MGHGLEPNITPNALGAAAIRLGGRPESPTVIELPNGYRLKLPVGHRTVTTDQLRRVAVAFGIGVMQVRELCGVKNAGRGAKSGHADRTRSADRLARFGAAQPKNITAQAGQMLDTMRQADRSKLGGLCDENQLWDVLDGIQKAARYSHWASDMDRAAVYDANARWIDSIARICV